MTCWRLVCLASVVHGAYIESFNTLDSRPECWPEQCAEAQSQLTWETITRCRDASYINCTYYGNFIYDNEAVVNLQLEPWAPTGMEDPSTQAGFIVSAQLPLLKREDEVPGFLARRLLFLNFTFDPPFQPSDALYPNNLCASALGRVPEDTPTVVPSEWAPDNVCIRDSGFNQGPAYRYRLNDTLEVWDAANRIPADLPWTLDAYSITNNELLWLIQPLARTITSLAVNGTEEYFMEYLHVQPDWEQVDKLEVSASLTKPDESTTACSLTLGNEADEVASVENCLKTLDTAIYTGSFAYDSFTEQPEVQCRSFDRLWTSLSALDLIGETNHFHADKVSIRMKNRAYGTCEVRLLIGDNLHAAEKCVTLGDDDDTVQDSPVTQLEIDTTDFVFSNVDLSRPLLGLSFSAELGRCGTGIHQIKVETAQVDFTLDLSI